jgi:hypothetical protein
MLLHEIITTNDKGTSAILTELLYKYKKSLYTYYKSYFNCDPILMVTSVFNAAQYALIVPANEFNEAIDIYLQNEDMNEEDKANQVELISFQSIMLKDF